MKKQVTILGAGITGLSLGFYLRERFKDSIDLTIIEKTHRPGGWVETLKEGPFLFEKGPHTLRCHGNGAYTLELIHRLGLQGELIYPEPASAIRYFLRNGLLEKTPSSLMEAWQTPLLKGKKRALIKGFLKWGSPKEDESIHSFATRRFSQEVAEDLFAPMILGIFAGDIKNLSLKHCFPSLYELDQKRAPFLLSYLLKNRSKSEHPMFSLKNGLEGLVQALAKQLHPFIRYNTEEAPKSDHIFSTIPLIGKIPRNSIAITHLGWVGKKLKFPGFGYLIPEKERSTILGVVFDSEIFPQQSTIETTRLTLMARTPHLEEALDHVRKVLKIEEKPDFCHQSLAKDAIPQYPPRFDQILEEFYGTSKKKVTPTSYLGSSYTGVSLNDCVAAAKKAADRFDPSS